MEDSERRSASDRRSGIDRRRHRDPNFKGTDHRRNRESRTQKDRRNSA